jgi:hypothetical protein
MFRKKGGATGIMASGPNMIKAALGTSVNLKNQFPSVGAFNYGIVPASTAIASPILTGDKKYSGIDKILKQYSEAPGSTIFDGPGQFKVDSIYQPGVMGKQMAQTKIFSSEEKDSAAEEAKKKAVKQMAEQEANINKQIKLKQSGETSDFGSGKTINEINKNILNKKTTENQEVVDEGTGDVLTTTEDDEGLVTDGTSTTDTGTDSGTTSTPFNFKDIQNKTEAEIKNIQNLYSNYSTDLSNLKNANILGKTIDKHREEYLAVLNKRPEEATFEDVRDSAFDLLGFDKESLDEKLTKDQQGSIWLNMMRAGLAMAAGESENALTNVAKGFQIGLEGYGRDMKTLTDDYREDIEKYQNTMYRLLKDKNSENIAKNALDVQRKAAEFAIVQQTRGEERKDLLDKLNTEVTMRKLKIESMSTLANFNLEKFKLDKSSAEFNELLEIKKAQVAALLPDEIKAAIGQGLIRVKDDSKLVTADNIELTEKGIDQEFDLVKSLKESSKKYRPSESMQKIKIQGRKGGYGLKAKPGEELSDEVQQELGLTLQNLTTSTSPFMKALDPTQGSPSTALEMLITAYRPLKDKGVILEYKSLPESIKKAIENESIDDGETLKTYEANTELFVGSP